VEPETVLGVRRLADDSWDHLLSRSPRIGYVRLVSFMRRTPEELKQLVKNQVDAGLKGLILDLRFNPGGYLDSAQKIADLFIDDGKIVELRGRAGLSHVTNGTKEGSYLDFPLVCLVNRDTGSGSEIVAACLQDHKRAVIMGERTNGSASVQNVLDFDGGFLRFTTSTFVGPSGKNLDRANAGNKPNEWGVIPDPGYVLNLSRKERGELSRHLADGEIIPRKDGAAPPDRKEFTDRQLEMALRYLRDQIPGGR
jgi:carboxyl-terminal processing protease